MTDTPETPPLDPEDQEKLPFTAHLEELRQRLIKCAVAVIAGFAACYGVSERLFAFFVQPLVEALPEGSHLAMIRVQEGFLTHLKMGFLGGVLLASPVILYQAWKFVAPGLYPHEKRYVWPFVGTATLFFFAGVTFAFTVVFPFGFKFLLAYAAGGPIQASISIDAYVGFAIKLLLAFGVVFELPVIVFFLAKMGLITHRTLSRNRGYAVVIIFIAAAVLTPPDVVTQLMMAGPLWVLYEISIVVARVFGPKPGEDEDGEEGEDTEEEPAEQGSPAG
ncbi:twin-arginine translocase subunit TatC [Deferrisoma palaeochoriense]